MKKILFQSPEALSNRINHVLPWKYKKLSWCWERARRV